MIGHVQSLMFGCIDSTPVMSRPVPPPPTCRCSVIRHSIAGNSDGVLQRRRERARCGAASCRRLVHRHCWAVVDDPDRLVCRARWWRPVQSQCCVRSHLCKLKPEPYCVRGRLQTLVAYYSALSWLRVIAVGALSQGSLCVDVVAATGQSNWSTTS